MHNITFWYNIQPFLRLSALLSKHKTCFEFLRLISLQYYDFEYATVQHNWWLRIRRMATKHLLSQVTIKSQLITSHSIQLLDKYLWPYGSSYPEPPIQCSTTTESALDHFFPEGQGQESNFDKTKLCSVKWGQEQQSEFKTSRTSCRQYKRAKIAMRKHFFYYRKRHLEQQKHGLTRVGIL